MRKMQQNGCKKEALNNEKFDKSIAAFEEAQDLMPGGVNSPVRAFKSVGMNPLFMERGKGSKVYDIDGNEYIDYVYHHGAFNSWACK